MSLSAELAAWSLALALGAASAGPARAAAEVEAARDWEQVWADCELALEEPASEAALARLALAAARAEPESPEAIVLATFLARRADPSAVLPELPGEPGVLSPAAAWIALELAPAGPRRDRLALVALAPFERDPGAAALEGRHLNLAWEAWRAAAVGLRFDAALALGRIVHGEAQAEWSAISLALTATRAGAYEEAERVLAAQLARAYSNGADAAALWTQRAITALANGNERAGRAYLGSAILLNSADAIAIWARLELAAGRPERARAGFRAALLQPEPGPWAQRGWGFALLPSAPAEPPHKEDSRG